MRDPVFKSRLAGRLNDYIAAMRAAGHPFEHPHGLLRLDKLMADEFPMLEAVTREAADRWIEYCQEGVHINTAIKLTTTVRGFISYLQARGIACAQIPSGSPGKYLRRQPHVISHEELRAFFKAADSMRPEALAPYQHVTAPVLFRLMACTGMRSGEAKRLSVGDVDLGTGIIRILKSKAHAERIVIAAPDLLEELRAYDCLMRQAWPGRKSFLVDGQGNQIPIGKISLWFHKIWDGLARPEAEGELRFSTKSFRHFYATERLAQWHREGRDLNAMRPYLMCWMGHTQADATDYYIHLGSDFRGEIEKAMEDSNAGVLPPPDDEDWEEMP